MDGTHTCLDILFKNDQNDKDDIILVKYNLKFIFNQFKQHRKRKCLPFIEISIQNV